MIILLLKNQDEDVWNSQSVLKHLGVGQHRTKAKAKFNLSFVKHTGISLIGEKASITVCERADN